MPAATTATELLARVEAGKAAVLSQTALLHRDFSRAQSNWKSDGTRVTPVDIAISENITATLRARFPDDEFFSEETPPGAPGAPNAASAPSAASEADAPIPLRARFAWILDPIDGTNNYALGLAHCAISAGLYENGQPVYGIIYDMSRRVLIHGGPGFGVTDGDRPAGDARVSQNTPTPYSLVGFHSPYDKHFAEQGKAIVANYKIRALGSSTLHLAYVANGILEGVIDHNVKLWDIAAAIPLLLAAGGEMHFFNNTNPLPVRVFDLHMKRIQYLAGSPAFCAHAQKILKA